MIHARQSITGSFFLLYCCVMLSERRFFLYHLPCRLWDQFTCTGKDILTFGGLSYRTKDALFAPNLGPEKKETPW